MSMTWLADVDSETFWAHRAWPEFGPAVFDEHALAILPLFAFADHGLGLPLDAEEILGSSILKRAVQRVKNVATVRVLPPIRFQLAPYPTCVFGLDPETARDLVFEVCEGVKAAGFQKLLLFATSPWNAEFADAVGRDVRVQLGVQTFVSTLGGLGLSFHPASEDRARTQAAVAKISGETPRPPSRAASVHDAQFRPGNFRVAPALPPGPPMDGTAAAQTAGDRLASILLEIVARPALIGGSRRSGLNLGPEPEALATNAAPIFPDGVRPRYLCALQREDWDKIPDKANAWVIVPVGSIEQHGPHLPVGVDAILGQAWLHHTLKRFPAGARLYVAPPITYGKSNEHLGYAGTLTISSKTLRRVLLAIATQLRAIGFKQIAFLNTHGGNTAVLTYTIREIQSALEMRAGILSRSMQGDVSKNEALHGFHAGEWETSLMLAVASDLVRMDKAVSEFPTGRGDFNDVRLNDGPAFVSWMTSDISESGVLGDAKAATLEKGELWLETGSEELAKKIANLDTL